MTTPLESAPNTQIGIAAYKVFLDLTFIIANDYIEISIKTKESANKSNDTGELLTLGY